MDVFGPVGIFFFFLVTCQWLLLDHLLFDVLVSGYEQENFFGICMLGRRLVGWLTIFCLPLLKSPVCCIIT